MQVYSLKLALPAFFALSANALFDCNEDQHAFDPTPGKFVVHFTTARDSSYKNEPWVRICIPNDSGSWDSVDPLGIPCDTAGAKKFSQSQTGLKADLNVGLGDACDKKGTMKGSYLEYKTVTIDLHGNYGNGNVCGKRDHGRSCQLDM